MEQSLSDSSGTDRDKVEKEALLDSPHSTASARSIAKAAAGIHILEQKGDSDMS